MRVADYIRIGGFAQTTGNTTPGFEVFQGIGSEAPMPKEIVDDLLMMVADYENEISIYVEDGLPVPIPSDEWLQIINRLMVKWLPKFLLEYLPFIGNILMILRILRIVLWVLETIEKIRRGSGTTEDALKKIREAIESLKYNNEVIDFGFLRVLLNGSVIEY